MFRRIGLNGARMSTVQICLNDILGVAVACEVIFYPGDTPFFSGSALAVSGARSIRLDAGGDGSVMLLPGRYAVRFSGITGNTDTLLILVPNDTAVYPLTELICGGNWVLPLRDFLLKTRNLADVANPALAFNAIKQAANAASAGVVQLATQAEVDAGMDAVKAVTPATLAATSRWAANKSKLVTVADAASRFALTAVQVSVSDLVEQLDTHAVFAVLDTAQLAHETGYVQAGIRPTPPPTLADGLLAFWNLDETSGVRLDAAGNGHDLSDVNGMGCIGGKIGNAASSDGTMAFTTGDDFELRNLSGYSVFCWYNSTDTTAGGAIISDWIDGWEFSTNTGNGGFFVAGLDSLTGPFLQDGNWHHIGLVKDEDTFTQQP